MDNWDARGWIVDIIDAGRLEYHKIENARHHLISSWRDDQTQERSHQETEVQSLSLILFLSFLYIDLYSIRISWLYIM